MRALLYLLTLTVSCFLQNVNCVNKNVEEFIKNKDAMDLVEKYHNNQINTQKDLLKQLNDIRIELCSRTLTNYLKAIKAAGGGSRKITFKRFKNDPHAMDLVEQFNNKQITDTELFEALKQINHKMSTKAMYLYLNRLNQEKNGGGTPNLSNQSPSEMWNFSNPTKDLDASPFIQASQIAQQSSNFTSGNPGSSEKGKSTNFSKGSNPDNWSHYSITGSAPHYGDAMPFQQAPIPDTSSFPAFPNQFNQSAPKYQPGTPSLDWSGGNSQNNDGSLYSVVRPRPSSSEGKSATKTGKKPRN